MSLVLRILPLVFFVFAVQVRAEDFFWDAKAQEKISQQELFNRLPGGSVLVLGDQPADESPASQDFHQRQGSLVRAYGIYAQSLQQGLDGALAYIAFNEDMSIELYFRGHLTPEKFLGEVSWPMSHPFSQYERQFYFPLYFQGHAFGISLPAPLREKIARTGLSSLTEEEKELLPFEIQRGSAAYFERFHAAHPEMSGAELEHHFESAFSDDSTIAWAASQKFTDKNHRAYIVVDEFHVLHHDGLMVQLKRVLPSDQKAFSLIQREALTEENKNLADFIWVHGRTNG
jgi:hypothetical protein